MSSVAIVTESSRLDAPSGKSEWYLRSETQAARMSPEITTGLGRIAPLRFQTVDDGGGGSEEIRASPLR